MKPPGRLKRTGKTMAGWLLATVITAVIATAASSQFVIIGLTQAGATIPLGERLRMAGQDLIDLGFLYAVFIAIAFAIAFFIAGLLARKIPSRRTVIFTVAGAVAMAVMLLAMERVFFGVPLIAGARSDPGFAAQMLCGALGGYVFANFRRARPVRDTLSRDDLLPL